MQGIQLEDRNDSTLAKFSGMENPVDHPFNRDGYRYYLAEPDDHAPNRKEFEAREETAGKPIPSYFYRLVLPLTVQLSSHDRAPQLRVGDDGLTVSGDKGYCVIRATHGVTQGTWYFEVAFKSQPPTSHVRIGWSQNLGILQAPVGYDKFSYGWRSRKGTVFHDSIGKHYADEGFEEGDILGCLIELPPPTAAEEPNGSGAGPHQPLPACSLPPNFKSLPLIKFKTHFYYEEKEEPELRIKSFQPHKHSKISFFKNGVCQGTAYNDIPAGTYYPALSMYKQSTLKVNFGPRFKAKPDTKLQYRPVSERARELPVEQSLSDILFFVENQGKLTLE